MKRTDKELYKTALRDDPFATRISTRIWRETASKHNPYIADGARCHGYDLFELIEKRGFFDVLYLLFQGELPDNAKAQLLEALFVALINPGPRHPATRAAMTAGIGKTDNAHILPIAMLTLGGSYLGGTEVSASMRFLNKNQRKSPTAVVRSLAHHTAPQEGDDHIVPGFGSRFGDVDLMAGKLAAYLAELPGAGPALAWGMAFSECLQKEHNYGWLSTGVAAATLSDLGFHPRTGSGLYQLMCGPGVLAHGLEMSNKPLTAMPFIDNDHYVMDRPNDK